MKTEREVIEFFINELAEVIGQFGKDSTLFLMANHNPTPDFLAGYEIGVETISELLRRTLEEWKRQQEAKS